MRIETYTQVQQLYQTKKIAKTDRAAKGSFSDQLQISNMGKDIQTAKQAVAPIKSAIQSGNYQVSEESLAAKLFQKYNEMR